MHLVSETNHNHCCLCPGYLKEQQCVKAVESFLRDSVHLAEYRNMLDQGFTAPLTISGRTLVETLCLCQADRGMIHFVRA